MIQDGGLLFVIVLDAIILFLMLLCFQFKKNKPKQNRQTKLKENEEIKEEKKETKEKKGFFKWIITTWKISNREIYAKSGAGSLNYLKFQKATILLFLFFTIFGVAIILPINVSAKNLPKNEIGLGSTTVNNISSQSRRLWAHWVFQILYNIVILLYLFFLYNQLTIKTNDVKHQHLLKSLKKKNKPSHFTILIENIPSNITEHDLFNAFNRKYPNEVISCYIAKQMNPYLRFRAKLIQNLDKLNFLKDHKAKGNAQIGEYFCCWESDQDLAKRIATYEKIVKRYEELVENKGNVVKQAQVGFVSFKRPSLVWVSLGDHKRSPILSSEMRMTPAPDHNNVMWNHISLTKKGRTRISILVYLGLFLLLLIYSTPVAFLNALRKLTQTYAFRKLEDNFMLLGLISSYLPSIASYLFTSVLPGIIRSAANKTAKFTATKQLSLIMRVDFIMMFFGLLVLPVISSVCIYVAVQDYIDSEKSFWSLFSQAFVSDNGATFMNMILQFAVFGCGLELIQAFDVYHSWKMKKHARTPNEKNQLPKKIENSRTFDFGFNWALQTVIISIVMLFSIMVPLVSPFGFFYFLFKHTVDKHNMIYFYNVKLHSFGEMPSSAISQIFIGLSFMNLTIAGFYGVRNLWFFFYSSVFWFVFSIFVHFYTWRKIATFRNKIETEMLICEDHDNESFPSEEKIKKSYNYYDILTKNETKLWGDLPQSHHLLNHQKLKTILDVRGFSQQNKIDLEKTSDSTSKSDSDSDSDSKEIQKNNSFKEIQNEKFDKKNSKEISIETSEDESEKKVQENQDLIIFTDKNENENENQNENENENDNDNDNDN